MYVCALEAGRIWVAEQEKRILGFVGTEPGEITLLFVLPDAASRGLGGRLFEFALSLAKTTFDAPITVVATKNSKSFYERYRFEVVEEQAFVRGVPELQYPVVRMLQRVQGLESHAPAKTDA